MSLRQIILDTETTGIDPKSGHRIVELGCVELVDRRVTGNNLHMYFNPDRVLEQAVIDVHGITNEYLADKPRYHEMIHEIMDYLSGAELIIHNAPFDLGFMNHELSLLERNTWGTIQDHCTILDTLVMARKRHPGQRNSLDALCKRYNVNNAHRQFHGALLDSQILCEVYMAMTGGQINLGLSPEQVQDEEAATATVELTVKKIQRDFKLKVVKASSEECDVHQRIASNSSS